MTISYKTLTGDDVSLLRQLMAVFADVFDEAHTYRSVVPDDVYMRSLLKKEQVIVIVACDGDRVVGGLVAYVLEKFEQPRREVYLYDLGVAEVYRRRGVATGLIGALKKAAADCGAYAIFVQADRVDTAAISLYGSLGVREEVYHFDIPVSGAGSVKD